MHVLHILFVHIVLYIITIMTSPHCVYEDPSHWREMYTFERQQFYI